MKNITKIMKIKPLQLYRLNKDEAFSVGKINLLEQTMTGSVIPLKYVNEAFVEISRIETISLKNFKLRLIKDFSGFWNGRYWK